MKRANLLVLWAMAIGLSAVGMIGCAAEQKQDAQSAGEQSEGAREPRPTPNPKPIPDPKPIPEPGLPGPPNPPDPPPPPLAAPK